MRKNFDGKIGKFYYEYLVLEGFNAESIEFSLKEAIREASWKLNECQTNREELAYIERLKSEARRAKKRIEKAPSTMDDAKEKSLSRFNTFLNKHKSRIPKKDEQSKFRWNGKPAQLGFLFAELKRKGFLDYPTTNGEESFSKAATVLMDMMDIDTSKGNLEKVLNFEDEDANITYPMRNKFTIPYLSDLQ